MTGVNCREDSPSGGGAVRVIQQASCGASQGVATREVEEQPSFLVSGEASGVRQGSGPPSLLSETRLNVDSSSTCSIRVKVNAFLEFGCQE